MRSRRRLCAWALVACIGASATSAGAPSTAWADETSPANVAAARRHFERARAYYAQGSYREAIGELEAAHTLDPNAKDLVFNLGVVHEKLGDIDDALRWFRLYTTMNLTPPERERADAYVHRLEGAKKELEDKQAAAAASGTSGTPHVTPPPPPPPAERTAPGRIDALTIGAASVSVASLVFGIIMGVKAEEDKPPSPYITGRNGTTYSDLVDAQANAHQEAVLADVGFAVATGAAAAAAVLFFTRSHVVGAPQSMGSGSTSVSAAPLAGGGAFFVQGSF
ncbi:MAG: tetratricopeptide repeat protein [Polyangiaceae bacterium]|jgi:tetratricopeptide (TPR) repeat protein